MLKAEAGEAAFITSTLDAPLIGERVEICEEQANGFGAASAASSRGPHMPRFGRVIRLDEPQGTTRRVAIRFELPASD